MPASTQFTLLLAITLKIESPHCLEACTGQDVRLLLAPFRLGHDRVQISISHERC